MAPQADDLTAERAAATLTLLKRKRLQSDAAKEQVICAALKTARQEALREAAKAARTFSKGYDIEWWMTMTKKEISAAMCRDVADELDRLASEGG